MGGESCGQVWLARHGQTVSNLGRRYASRSGESLTPAGRQQIAELGSRLAAHKVGSVWSSQIVRARESAELLSEMLCVPLVSDSRLDEMLLWPWEGLTEEEVAARYPQAYALWQARPDNIVLPGRETLDQVKVRINAAVYDGAMLPEPPVLVTHVAPIRVAALTFLGLPLRHYKLVDVGNADAMLVEPELGRVRRLNGSASLAGELELSPRTAAREPTET